jgi:hypothetical protein
VGKPQEAAGGDGGAAASSASRQSPGSRSRPAGPAGSPAPSATGFTSCPSEVGASAPNACDGAVAAATASSVGSDVGGATSAEGIVVPAEPEDSTSAVPVATDVLTTWGPHSVEAVSVGDLADGLGLCASDRLADAVDGDLSTGASALGDEDLFSNAGEPIGGGITDTADTADACAVAVGLAAAGCGSETPMPIPIANGPIAAIAGAHAAELTGSNAHTAPPSSATALAPAGVLTEAQRLMVLQSRGKAKELRKQLAKAAGEQAEAAAAQVLAPVPTQDVAAATAGTVAEEGVPDATPEVVERGTGVSPPSPLAAPKPTGKRGRATGQGMRPKATAKADAAITTTVADAARGRGGRGRGQAAGKAKPSPKKQKKQRGNAEATAAWWSPGKRGRSDSNTPGSGSNLAESASAPHLAESAPAPDVSVVPVTAVIAAEAEAEAPEAEAGTPSPPSRPKVARASGPLMLAFAATRTRPSGNERGTGDDVPDDADA